MKESMPLSLTQKDIESGKKFVFTDSLATWFDRMRINRFIRSGHVVVSQDIGSGIRDKAWFKQCLKDDSIRQFTWHAFPYAQRYRADDAAYDIVESVYKLLDEKGHIPIEPLRYLYGDEHIEMVFKKELILRLTDYFSTINAFKNLKGAGCPVVFLPSPKWLGLHYWFKALKACNSFGDFSMQQETFFESLIRCIYVLWYKWLAIFRLLGISGWVLSRIRRLYLRCPEPINAQLAIRLYKDGWSLQGEGTYEADWLLDGKRFTADNTVFVAETPLYKTFEEEIGRRGYRLEQQSRCSAFRNVSAKFLFNFLFLRKIVTVIPLAIIGICCPYFFVNTSARAWIDYLRWKCFVEKWQPKHYFTYNDITYNHIFRNIILAQAGCRSWFFDYSNSKTQIYEVGQKNPCRDATRAYRMYDTEINWGTYHTDLARSQFNRSSSFMSCGPLWSDYVQCTSRVEKILQEKFSGMPEGIMLAAFTTTNHDAGTNSEQAHCNFLKTLESLLNDSSFPNLKILFKPKYHGYEDYMGCEGTDIADVFERLKNNPRFIVLNSYLSASTVLYFSNITVSMAFCSPTVEALMARRRAVYYDSCNNYPHSYFERFPDLVAHDEKRLKELITHWLNTSDEALAAYVDEYIVPEYGGRLEKNPIELIRTEMSN